MCKKKIYISLRYYIVLKIFIHVYNCVVVQKAFNSLDKGLFHSSVSINDFDFVLFISKWNLRTNNMNYYYYINLLINYCIIYNMNYYMRNINLLINYNTIYKMKYYCNIRNINSLIINYGIINNMNYCNYYAKNINLLINYNIIYNMNYYCCIRNINFLIWYNLQYELSSLY